MCRRWRSPDIRYVWCPLLRNWLSGTLSLGWRICGAIVYCSLSALTLSTFRCWRIKTLIFSWWFNNILTTASQAEFTSVIRVSIYLLCERILIFRAFLGVVSIPPQISLKLSIKDKRINCRPPTSDRFPWWILMRRSLVILASVLICNGCWETYPLIEF